ncbi:hypothetical protein [Stenotrophomonas phage StM171]|nr:hypothetical protein [Stenotrophomonas phage StM171]
MHPQAVRRSPLFFATRARLRAIARWYRGLDLQTQADAAFGAFVVVCFFVLGIGLQVVGK